MPLTSFRIPGPWWAGAAASALTATALLATAASAQQPTLRDTLLDRFAGRWVLRGTIAGKPTTHDVTGQWVLGHQYLRLHEVSREAGAGGAPAYAADVYIGWDAKARAYTCVWLDTYGGVDAQSLGRTPPVLIGPTARGDSLPFLFHYDDGTAMHTTFAYNRTADTWAWQLDAEPAGQPDARRPFARVTLTRAPRE